MQIYPDCLCYLSFGYFIQRGLAGTALLSLVIAFRLLLGSLFRLCVFVCRVGGMGVHKGFLFERGLLTWLYKWMVTVGYSSTLSPLDEADIFMYSSQLVCSASSNAVAYPCSAVFHTYLMRIFHPICRLLLLTPLSPSVIQFTGCLSLCVCIWVFWEVDVQVIFVNW